MRAEVGLMTRNVVIRGCDENIEEEKEDCEGALASEHGAHIMMFSPGDESTEGRIEYA